MHGINLCYMLKKRWKKFKTYYCNKYMHVYGPIYEYGIDNACNMIRLETDPTFDRCKLNEWISIKIMNNNKIQEGRDINLKCWNMVKVVAR